MFTLNCKGRLLAIERPVVMGILNVTPDSFYAGSRYEDTDAVLARAEQLLSQGAAILDIGGQSTRPGSRMLTADEELSRVITPVEAIHRRFPEAILSIDTFHARVAAEAVAAGVSMVNDVSGGQDPEMLNAVGRLGVPYVCMHIKNLLSDLHRQPHYEDVTREVLDYFIQKLAACKKAGIHDVIVDPGFGFDKNSTHNFQLLRHMDTFRILDRPLLAGLSRKSTIYRTLGTTAAEALNGTTVLNVLALQKGAHILRVHDVREAVEAITLYEAYSLAGVR
ncbi:MAG: dihydropteroate synthase [Bacteroidetes bacterium]|nr:dihydropteroate synthase [Bacteroidota bacterium]